MRKRNSNIIYIFIYKSQFVSGLTQQGHIQTKFWQRIRVYQPGYKVWIRFVWWRHVTIPFEAINICNRQIRKVQGWTVFVVFISNQTCCFDCRIEFSIKNNRSGKYLDRCHTCLLGLVMMQKTKETRLENESKTTAIINRELCCSSIWISPCCVELNSAVLTPNPGSVAQKPTVWHSIPYAQNAVSIEMKSFH